MGHTTGVAISVAGGYSDTAPATQAEQMHQNSDSKEPDEPVLSRLLERIIVNTFIYPTFITPPMAHQLSDQYAFRPTVQPPLP